MAAETCALALDDRATSAGVAGLDRPAIERIHVAEEGDDAGDLSGIELEGLHPGAGNAGRDDPDEILIGRRVAELAAAEIDAADAVSIGAGEIGAADAVSIGAVAGRALRVIEPRPVGDVGRRVLARMRGLPEGEPR